MSDKRNQKVKDDNLLNFYLSSITVKDFKYEPNNKTKKSIWEYMNAANLIKIDDISDKEKITRIENAANRNQIDKNQIFKIYKQIPFDLNSLINAENIYQSFDGVEARALIYQKFLLSDNIEKKINLLFLLKDLFRKAELANTYNKFLSDRLKEINSKDIPKKYANIVERNIITNSKYFQKKIKFDDIIFHRSKLIRYFYEDDYPLKKTQKELENIYKKIKNRNYFYSAKDLAVLESLEVDGIKVPKEIGHEKLKDNYSVPDSLLSLAKKGEKGFLLLK